MKHHRPVTNPPLLGFELFPAEPDRTAEIAGIWYSGWADGHLGHVPEELVNHRQEESFLQRAVARIPDTTVAIDNATGAVAGFVMVRADEVEQLYVDARCRGTEVAPRLLAHAEQKIAVNHTSSWLAVVARNARARRFYERCGWSDHSSLDHVAEIAGDTMIVPSRRYKKSLSTRCWKATK